MALSLLDIAPAEEHRETVLVLGQELEIRGLTVTDLGRLCKRFPDLRKALFSATVPEDVQTAAMLEAWPAIIAAGTGNMGDAAHEAAAERLPQAELLKLGGAIMALSNPQEPEEAGPLAPAAVDAAPGDSSTASSNSSAGSSS